MAQMRLAVAAVGLLFLFENYITEAVIDSTKHTNKTLAEYCTGHYANDAINKIANVTIGTGKQCMNRQEKLSARLLDSKEWRHALFIDRYANKKAFKRLQGILADFETTTTNVTNMAMADLLSITKNMVRVTRLPRLLLSLIALPIMLVLALLNVSSYMLLWGGIDMRWERLHICSMPYTTKSTFLSSSDIGSGRMQGIYQLFLRRTYIVLDVKPKPEVPEVPDGEQAIEPRAVPAVLNGEPQNEVTGVREVPQVLEGFA